MKEYKKYIEDPFFSYIITCWAILGCELIFYAINQLCHLSINIHYLIMIAFWIISFVLIYQKVKKEQHYDMFAVSTQPTSRQFTYAILIAVLFVLFSNMIFGGLKPIQYLKLYDIGTYCLILLYNISELLMAMMILLLGQHYVERFTNNAGYAYGGFVLAITWGLLYIINGLTLGIYMITMSICVGFIFIMLRKNPKWTFLLFVIMYLL